MRMSDWSSDVCSSDLRQWRRRRLHRLGDHEGEVALHADAALQDVVDERLVGRHVARDHLQEIVDAAAHGEAANHLRDRAHGVLEALEVARLMALELDLHQEAGRRRDLTKRPLGVVAADETVLLEAPPARKTVVWGKSRAV